MFASAARAEGHGPGFDDILLLDRMVLQQSRDTGLSTKQRTLQGVTQCCTPTMSGYLRQTTARLTSATHACLQYVACLLSDDWAILKENVCRALRQGMSRFQ